jgi:hypothetical protein
MNKHGLTGAVTERSQVAEHHDGVSALSAYNPLKASLEMIKRRVRPSGVVISNCQTFGIVNSMRAYTDKLDLDGVPITEINGQSDEFYLDRLAKYDHIFVIAQLSRLTSVPGLKSKVKIIPSIYFQGYHPDAIMLTANGRMINGPIGGYQSCIVYASFIAGCSKEQTFDFFNSSFYEQVGYFEEWQNAKAALFEQFRSLGYSAEAHFYRWCVEGAFMHTVNHPKIRVLSSLAFDMLQKIDCLVENEPEEIGDNLANGTVFPVYPEIAALTGARGSYRFKPHTLNETLNLREFIELSFEGYRGSDPSIFSIHPVYQQRFDVVAALIRRLQGSLLR